MYPYYNLSVFFIFIFIYFLILRRMIVAHASIAAPPTHTRSQLLRAGCWGSGVSEAQRMPGDARHERTRAADDPRTACTPFLYDKTLDH